MIEMTLLVLLESISESLHILIDALTSRVGARDQGGICFWAITKHTAIGRDQGIHIVQRPIEIRNEMPVSRLALARGIYMQDSCLDDQESKHVL